MTRPAINIVCTCAAAILFAVATVFADATPSTLTSPTASSAATMTTAPAVPLAMPQPNGTSSPATPPVTSPTAASLPATTTEPVITRLQRVVNDVVYLVDVATGKRVMLLPGDWSPDVIDEFHRFLTRDRQSPETPYTIRLLRAEGRVEPVSTNADQPVASLLRLRINLEVVTRSQGVVRVPIAMSEGAILAGGEPLTCTGHGRAELTIAPDGTYILIITNNTENDANGESVNGAPYTTNVALTLCFPVVATGENDYRCVISFPNALTSEMKVTVPMADAAATVPRDAILLASEPSGARQQDTTFTIQSLKNRFELSWRPLHRDLVRERPVVVAENGVVVVRLTPSETRYEAEIPVRSLTTPIDRISVRLPVGATLDATTRHSVVNYSVRPAPQNDPTRGEVLEIAFNPPTLGPVSLTLRATHAVTEGNEDNWSETVGGFEVIGAEKQFGTITVIAPNDVHTSWSHGSGLHRAPLPPELASESAAKFDYFTVPFAIQTKVRTPQSRINVKPEHVIQISRDRALLTSRFTFNIYGTKTDLLQIDLGTWRWIELGPSHLIDIGGVFKDANNRLYIPLRGLTEGVVDIELKAYLPWELLTATTPKLLDFPIPMPIGDWVEPAPVAIVPADNIKLFPVSRDSAYDWLDVSQVTTDLVSHIRRFLLFRSEIPRKQQEPLIYQTSGDTPVFVAGVLYTPRRVSMVSETVIRPTEPSEQVTQTIGYTVEFEPLERVTLWVPSILDQNPTQNQKATLRVSLAGKSDQLTISTVPGETIQKDGIVYVKKSILLAGLGYSSLVLSYSIDPIDVRQGVSIQRTIPLVVPADPFPLIQSVTVEVPRGIGVTLYDTSRTTWTPRETKSYSVYQQQRFTFVASDVAPQPTINIQLALDDPDALGMTVVRRVWLQTWLKGDVRTDFLAMLVSTNRPSLTIKLPPGVVADKCHALVGGVSVVAPLLGDNEIQIPLGENRSREPVVVDVRYQLPAQSGAWPTLELPQFLQSTLVRNVYWNVVLPSQQHLVSTPAGWTPEYRWKWNGFFWTRAPLIDIAQIDFPSDLLKDYTASPQTNQYLFSSFNPSGAASLVVLSRSVMVFVASAFVLAASLAVIYFPRLRYATSLVILLLATVAAVIVQPTLSLLAMQASVLGILLVIVSLYFYRLFVVRKPYALAPVGDAAPSQHTPYAVIIDESEVAPAAIAPEQGA
ncbi:MAG: hypothetical protein ACRC46_08635 [Thermoguttaceae bacterium]